MKDKPKSTAQRWRITRIVGNAARQLTVLEAKSADDAIKQAIKDFGITDPHQQRRLGAYRVA